MRRWAEITSFVVGAAAALVLLAGWQVPQGRDTVGATARLSIARSAIVELSRTGTVIDETHALPGGVARTAVVVTNSSSSVLRLVPRAEVGEDPVLARMLRLDVRANGAPLYRGRLAGLTGDAGATFRLVPGESARITVVLRLPRSVGRRAMGRETQASLAFEAAR